MTIANESVPKQKLALRPRPPVGLGAALIGKEEEELVLQVLRNQEPFRYYGHDAANPPGMAAQLEKEFAEKYGFQYALAVTSGTAALQCALAAMGIGPGDEVIVPAWSWISCFTAVVRVGAMPVLAEIDETFCLGAGEITRLMTPRTKAAMVIHYQGVAADMEKLSAEAHSNGIKILEDCAEAVGATYRGKSVGLLGGDMAIFSFQYHKFMTSGEGGMVATNDPTLYERAVRFHDIGQVRPYHAKIKPPTVPAFSGDQFRMTELTAAMALAQFRKVDQIKSHCRKMSRRVMEKISDLAGITPRRIPDPAGDTGFEMYFSLPTTELAVEFSKRLEAMNVNARKTTFTYCHYAREYCKTGHAHTPAASPFRQFKDWPAKGYRQQDFPKTEAIVHNFLAIPVGIKYTDEDADYIAAAIRQVHGELVGKTL
jgi:8-amino-3,8-dideoxy-alpha-D-manno-octulosonate transaminase